jgi:hypothetical protein
MKGPIRTTATAKEPKQRRKRPNAATATKISGRQPTNKGNATKDNTAKTMAKKALARDTMLKIITAKPQPLLGIS